LSKSPEIFDVMMSFSVCVSLENEPFSIYLVKVVFPVPVEPKTRTYKPEEHIKSRKFNINKRNNENDYDEEEDFFRDPFMNESKFGCLSKLIKQY